MPKTYITKITKIMNSLSETCIIKGHEIACRETVANICHAFDQSEEGKQLMLEVLIYG